MIHTPEREIGGLSAEARIGEMRQAVAHCVKQINDVMQVIMLTAEGHRLKEIHGEEQWRAFHEDCMGQILGALDRLKAHLAQLKHSLVGGETADSEIGI